MAHDLVKRAVERYLSERTQVDDLRGIQLSVQAAGVVPGIALAADVDEQIVLTSPDCCARWTVVRNFNGGRDVSVTDTGPSSSAVVNGPAVLQACNVGALAAVGYVRGRGTVENTNARPQIVALVTRAARELVRPAVVTVADSAAAADLRDMLDIPATGNPAIEVGVPPGLARSVRVLPNGVAVVCTVVNYLSGATVATATVPVTGLVVPIPVFGRLFAVSAAAATRAVFQWGPEA